MLQACLEAAEKTIAEKAVQEEAARDAGQDANVLRVSESEYNWLLQKLEEAPQESPALRRLLSETPIWNG